MKITQAMLKDWNASRSFFEWFMWCLPEGEGDYQTMLNTLAADDRPAYALWLMEHAGADDSAVVVDSFANGKHLFVAGKLIIKNDVNVSGWLMAGSSIKVGGTIKTDLGIRAGLGIQADGAIYAGGSIEAGGAIKAGWSIKAGEGVNAGGDIEIGWHIEAGWNIAASKNLKAGCSIQAGSDIKAGGNIHAGEAIKAGWGIEAGENIEIDNGYGIFAGLRIGMNQWPLYAKVTAKTRPHNLASGSWASAANSRKEVA